MPQVVGLHISSAWGDKVYFLFFWKDAECRLTLVFDPKWESVWKTPSTWPEWVSDRAIKETETRKTAAWRNGAMAYWKAAGGEAWCLWHAWNSMEPQSNFCVRVKVSQTGWHFKAISLWWPKFMQHNTNQRDSLGLIVTSLHFRQNKALLSLRQSYVVYWVKKQMEEVTSVSLFSLAR